MLTLRARESLFEEYKVLFVVVSTEIAGGFTSTGGDTTLLYKYGFAFAKFTNKAVNAAEDNNITVKAIARHLFFSVQQPLAFDLKPI
jgi:hypothetical protein